jgi:predicted metal-dependent RNase
MLPTLEQTAQQIAEQRREAGKKLFESAYQDLLPALKGSLMFYEAAINRNDKVEIIFSKPGLSKVILALRADGKVAKGTAGEALEIEALTTILADHIVSQEETIAKADELKKVIKRYQRWTSVSFGLAAIILAVSGLLEKSNYLNADQWPVPLIVVLGSVFIAMMYSFIKWANADVEYGRLKSFLPNWY